MLLFSFSVLQVTKIENEDNSMKHTKLATEVSCMGSKGHKIEF